MIHYAGVDGYDVYNCSQLFEHDGHRFMYGRVEKRGDWINSHTRLFVEVGRDSFAAVVNSQYPLEDPFVSQIGGEWVLGGTHVRKAGGQLAGYWGDFYRGSDLTQLRYFTSGPDGMKDIRLVSLADGQIGVFSRPRQTNAMVGFTVIKTLAMLTPDTIAAAQPVAGLFAEGEWGGVNQAYLLADGHLGVLSHRAYAADGSQHYSAWCFEFDPITRAVRHYHCVAQRADFPAGAAKLARLTDVVFPSGMVDRHDGQVDLYCGLNDVEEARKTMPYPFTVPLGGKL